MELKTDKIEQAIRAVNLNDNQLAGEAFVQLNALLTSRDMLRRNMDEIQIGMMGGPAEFVLKMITEREALNDELSSAREEAAKAKNGLLQAQEDTEVVTKERDALKVESDDANRALIDSMQTESKRDARIAELERMAVSDATMLRDERHHRNEVSELLVERTNERDQAREQRDRLQGICERLKRELEEALSSARAAHDARVAELTKERDTAKVYAEVDAAILQQNERIRHLEDQLAAADRETEVAIAERDQARAELEASKPEALAERIDFGARVSREYDEQIEQLTKQRDEARAEVGAQQVEIAKFHRTLDRMTYDLETAHVHDRELQAQVKDVTQQVEQAEGRVHELRGELEAAQARELKALRQLGDLVTLTSKPTIFEYAAPGSAGACPDCGLPIAPNRLHQCDAMVNCRAAMAHAKAEEVRRDLQKGADLLGPAGKPASAESEGGLSDVRPTGEITCGMLMPDGVCGAQAVANYGLLDLCKRHLAVVLWDEA